MSDIDQEAEIKKLRVDLARCNDHFNEHARESESEVERLRELIDADSKTLWEQQPDLARLRRIEEAMERILDCKEPTVGILKGIAQDALAKNF